MFHILIIDDDPIGARLLQEVMKNIQRPHELHFVWDGLTALDFLRRRGVHRNAPRPSLILLDVNMARVDGLETLVAIKSDPELRAIPVIMLSTSSAQRDIWESSPGFRQRLRTKAHNLALTEKFVQALGIFGWISRFCPSRAYQAMRSRQMTDSRREGRRSGNALQAEIHSGSPIAPDLAEARSRAMQTEESPAGTAVPRKSGCEEHNRLLDDFGASIRELIDLHEQQFLAIVEGDSECHRFDLLIHMANERKQMAKYAYLRHVEEHGCSN